MFACGCFLRFSFVPVEASLHGEASTLIIEEGSYQLKQLHTRLLVINRAGLNDSLAFVPSSSGTNYDRTYFIDRTAPMKAFYSVDFSPQLGFLPGYTYTMVIDLQFIDMDSTAGSGAVGVSTPSVKKLHNISYTRSTVQWRVCFSFEVDKFTLNPVFVSDFGFNDLASPYARMSLADYTVTGVKMVEDPFAVDAGDTTGLGNSAKDNVGKIEQGAGGAGEADGMQSGLWDMYNANGKSRELKFPGFAIAAGGETHQIWGDTSFNLQVIDNNFGVLMLAVRTITVALVYIALIHYMTRVWKNIVGGD